MPIDYTDDNYEAQLEREAREAEYERLTEELRDAGVDVDDPDFSPWDAAHGDPSEVDEDGLYPDGSREDEPGPGMG